jgi:hypothetical protein
VVRKTSPSEEDILQAAIAALIGHFRSPIEQDLCAPEHKSSEPVEAPAAAVEATT